MNKFVQVKKVVATTSEVELIKLSTSSFLIKAIEQFSNREFENNEVCTEIIKVLLPLEKEEAERVWFEGIEVDEQLYKGWFATTSGIKQEQEDGKCETIFVRSDIHAELTTKIEDLVSLRKFKANLGNKFYLNKSILSRLSLITSNYEQTINMPNLVVLKEATRNFKRTYTTFAEDFTTMEDYNFDGDINIFDGGCVAGTEVFNTINKAYNRDDIEFFIFRLYGVGGKGLATKFKITDYLNKLWLKNGNTDTFKFVEKENKFYMLDMWNQWQKVDENTILLNETQVKLAGMFTDMEEIKKLYSEFDNELLNKLYITKVNKKEEDINEYSLLNYQMLQALALTSEDIKELAKTTIDDYKKIAKPFTALKNEEETEEITFKANIDNIMLYYKYIANSDDTEFMECANIVQKIAELLQVNKNIVNCKTVRNHLKRLITRASEQIAVGKFTVKGNVKYIAIDGIAYLNYHAGNKMDNELKHGEFFTGDANKGDIRTISRNPLTSYSEVLNVKFTDDKLGYYPKSREIIVFNTHDDTLNIMSSADQDGDLLGCWDNQIIKDSVIPCTKPFYNSFDGAKANKMAYTPQNVFNATYDACGNLIGKYAIIASAINTLNQNHMYKMAENNKYFSYERLKELWIFKYGKKVEDIAVNLSEEEYIQTKQNIEDYNNTYYKKMLKEKIEEGKIIPYYNLPNEEVKEQIKKNYIKNYMEICKVNQVTMIAIDTPKTLLHPSDVCPNLMDYLQEEYSKKPYFLRYKTNKKYKPFAYLQNNFSTLNMLTKHLENELLDSINKYIYAENTKPLLYPFKKDMEVEVPDDVQEAVDKLTKGYKTSINTIKSGNLGEDNKKIRNQKLTELDMVTAEDMVKLINKYGIEQIRTATKRSYINESFMINCAYMLYAGLSNNIRYVENADGDITFRHKKYTKVTLQNSNEDTIKALQTQQLLDNKRIMTIGVRISDSINPVELVEGEVLNKEDMEIFEGKDYKIEDLPSKIIVHSVPKITAKSFRLNIYC